MQVCKVECSVVLSLPGNAAAVSGLRAVSRFRGYEWVSIAFAIVLLVGAGLKGQQLIARGLGPLDTDKSWSLAGIAVEWLVASWLLSGFAKLWARRATIALFLIYSGIASTRLVIGEVDCGCFGNLRLHPAWTLAIDVIAVGAFLIIDPFESRANFRQTSTRWKSNLSYAMLLSILIPAATIGAFRRFSNVGDVAAHAAKENPLIGLVCNEPRFNVGVVPPDANGSARHVFRLTNTTRRTIKITKLSASCGCASATPSTNTIAPGDSVDVPVKVDWKGRNGTQSASVTLFTDAEASPAVVLSIVGSVSNLITISPAILDFGTLDPGLSEERTFEVFVENQGKPQNILNVQSTNKAFRVRGSNPALDPEPLTGAPEKFAVRVLVPTAADVEETGQILLFTSLRTDPFPVWVIARSKGGIVATPRSLRFTGRDTGGLPAAKELRVQVANEQIKQQFAASIAPSSESQFFSVDLDTWSVDGKHMSTVLRISFRDDLIRRHVAELVLRGGESTLSVPIVAEAEK
ncbi:MAG TPA: DUF1573 domain-containing protein [Tepidisphaeraceae bacterium]|nr:DUF1573 domain-containing protein [Tepidisphaeraceae bacterium]